MLCYSLTNNSYLKVKRSVIRIRKNSCVSARSFWKKVVLSTLCGSLKAEGFGDGRTMVTNRLHSAKIFHNADNSA